MREKILFNHNVHFYFVEFQKAYDSILIEFGISRKFISLIEMSLNNTEAEIKIGGEITETFRVEARRWILFNLVMENIKR